MNSLTLKFLLLTIVLAAMAAVPALADDNDDDGDDPVTMRVMDESDDPDQVFERIELPEQASAVAVERSEHGLQTANDAREDGRAFGQATAEEARERAGGAGEAAENARSDARDRFASDIARGDLDNLPEQARQNIPDDVQERIREARDRRRGPPGGGDGGN